MHEQSVSRSDIIFMKVKTILIFIYKQINEEPVPTNVLIKFAKHFFYCTVLDMQENIDTQLSYKMNVVV